jgi:membrane protease YdiL (CAAX protease family)
MNRPLVVAFVVFTGFFLCWSLPGNSHIPGPLKHPLVSHLTFPVLILLLLRMNPLRNGLGIGNWRKGIWLSFLISIAVLLSCFFIAKEPALNSYYSSPNWGAGDAKSVMLGEWGRLKGLIGWEFLFRGLLLFPLYEAFGPVANLIQATVCAVAHVHKPLVELYGSFPFALVLGYLATKSGSVWYGVYVHWLLGFSLQVYITVGNRGSVPFL